MPKNLASFVEYENGNRQSKHVFMRMLMPNGDIEEVDMYIDRMGKKYCTRLDKDIKSAKKIYFNSNYYSYIFYKKYILFNKIYDFYSRIVKRIKQFKRKIYRKM